MVSLCAIYSCCSQAATEKDAQLNVLLTVERLANQCQTGESMRRTALQPFECENRHAKVLRFGVAILVAIAMLPSCDAIGAQLGKLRACIAWHDSSSDTRFSSSCTGDRAMVREALKGRRYSLPLAR